MERNMADGTSVIGRKIVLWKLDHRIDAYTDQMGISHPGAVVLEEIPVTIIQTKNVPGNYSKKDHTMAGWKAVSERGEEFVCNWDHYPEDSYNPTYSWTGRGNRRLELFVDACQAYNMKVVPVATRGGIKAVPTGAHICEKHDKVYVDESIGCFLCWTENLPPMEAQKSPA